jgi:ketosteroid isomerase-like protein
MQYFAPDGIWFVPHPKVTVSDLASRPAPTSPPMRRLEWAPMYGDVSRAGDMGYDTGPSANSDLSAKKEPTRYGHFFSIWKKQPDGTWRVALDLGTQGSDVWDPAKPPEFTAGVPSRWNGKPSGDDKASLMAAEGAFSSKAKAEGMAKAAEHFVESGARAYRNNVSPVIGRNAIVTYFAQKNFNSHWEPIEGFVARSADLGYTYGRYWNAASGDNAQEEAGYYVHVWRRDAAGDWKVVFDVTSPADLEKK